MRTPSVDAARVMAQRWLGGAVDIVRPVLGGATNQTFRIRAADERFFLRRYRNVDQRAVEREHALIRHVNAHGVSAPQAIASNESSVLRSDDGGLWAMFRAAMGMQVELTDVTAAHAHGAGVALAELHRATASADIGFGTITLAWDGPSWVARLHVVRDAIVRRGASSAVDGWALERVEAQARWLADERARHQYVPRFPGQIVHGDYQNSNLFFDGDRVCDVIDWETAAEMPRAYELARAIYFMCRMEPALTAAMVDGYRSVTQLDDTELDDGATAWGTYADHHVWPVEQLYLHDNGAAARFIWHRPFRPFADEWHAART